MNDQHHPSIYGEVSGGADLLKWFGHTPSFGDAEILSLDLRRKGQSVLRAHTWMIASTEPGVHVPERHVIVSFLLNGVMDLQLDGFSVQNVVGGLILRRAPDRPERRRYLWLAPVPNDIEIELEPCYGLGGFIRARSVAIVLQPGEPDAQV